jgi:hypothetical protein
VKLSWSSSQKLRSDMNSSNATAFGVMSGADAYLRRHGARTVGRGWGSAACVHMLVSWFAWPAWLVGFTLVLFASFRSVSSCICSCLESCSFLSCISRLHLYNNIASTCIFSSAVKFEFVPGSAFCCFFWRLDFFVFAAGRLSDSASFNNFFSFASAFRPPFVFLCAGADAFLLSFSMSSSLSSSTRVGGNMSVCSSSVLSAQFPTA